MIFQTTGEYDCSVYQELYLSGTQVCYKMRSIMLREWMRKEDDNELERGREKEREREKQSERERGREKDRGRKRERERERKREREREKERESIL